MSTKLIIFCLLVGPLRVLCQRSEGMTMIATWTFTISSQGRNLCPDSSGSSSFRIIRARSQLDCARKCKGNPDCIYHSYHKDNGTCQHGLYGAIPTSLISSSGCQLMVDADAFKGCFPQVKPSGTCDMPFQYNNGEFRQCAEISGLKCMNSSEELIDCIAPAGFTVSQEIATLELNQTNVPLPCISNWIVLMSRYNGVVDFNRNWADYREGFGDLLTSEFWIGNDNIHLLTSQPSATYMLRIEIQAKDSFKWYYAEYTPFFVDSESNGYMIHVSGFQGNAGDSLTNMSLSWRWYHDKTKFSTLDVENDSSVSRSCASVYGCGWWFSSCWAACLTCSYTADVGIGWETLFQLGLEATLSLRAARMMVMAIA